MESIIALNKNLNNNDIQMKTYRFKFTDLIVSELEYFAQLHQFDDRKTFKDAWKEWFNSDKILPLMNYEIKRLTNNGYRGNVEEKMFKSARYYFRKKPTEKSDEKKERKEYIGFSDEMLKSIDEHILSQLKANIESTKNKKINNVMIIDVQPSDAYVNFCENNKEKIKKEINYLATLKNKKPFVPSELSIKFKKTYKNRYYNIRVALSENNL
jgi:hypothetical protein